MRIITVGAGPCGLHCSGLLEKMGHSVRILEEHQDVGAPVNCAGLVGNDVLELFGRSSVINTINGAHIFYGDKDFTIMKKGVAHVVDRLAFDRSFDTGVEMVCGQRVRSVVRNGDAYRVKTSSAAYDADVVIGADGPVSVVRKSLFFKNGIQIYPAYQEYVRCEPCHDDMVVVDVSRPFFSWIVPQGDGVCRIGTIGPRCGLSRMRRKFFVKGRTVARSQAPIPVGPCEVVRGSAALVGDAAGQTKPLSGGGLFYGLKAAGMLADAIGRGSLHHYTREWNETFGKEIRFGMRARALYEALSDPDLERIFSNLCKKRGQIEKMADFDRHSSLLRIMVSMPRVATICGKYLHKLL